MSAVVTIKTFVEGISPLVTEKALDYVCTKRKVRPDTDLNTLTERETDLIEGTVYYWLSNLPVGGSTEKVSDGNFSHSEGGWTVSKANITEWLHKYSALFAKWNEPQFGRSTIRIINF